MSKQTQKELLRFLGMMKSDALQYWNSPLSKQSYSKEKIFKETRGIAQAYDQLKEIIIEHFGLKNWTCTFEEYYALPEPIRNYIAALETNADPPSMVRENIFFKETIAALERKNELLILTIEARQKPTVTRKEISSAVNEGRNWDDGSFDEGQVQIAFVELFEEKNVEVVEK